MEPRLVPSVVSLHAGDDLQAAINNAQPGDQLVLDAGASFSGPITLPNKTGSQWITIESSALSQLPDGQRVGPQDASLMPKITSPGLGEPALQTSDGAHNFRFVGIEFLPATASASLYDLIDLGDGSGAQTSLSQVPHDLTIDRCYVHAWLDQPVKRGIALNSASTEVINSYVSSFKVDGQDSQAISGWNGPGPFTIDNNYLEAAGENILFGGAGATIPNLIPSNIEIKGNLVTKPLSWNSNDPSSYAGTHWSVKNLLELKNAQQVTIEGNQFENNWLDAQTGFAIVFTPRGDQSGGPWVTVSNITFANNLVAHSAQGVDILGSDDSSTSQFAQNITIQNNLFQDLGASRFGSTSGRAFEFLPGNAGGSKNVTITANTVTSDGTLAFADGTHSGFVFTNNIAPNGEYGIYVNALGSTLSALQTAFPGSTLQGNLIVGGNTSNFPGGNACPSTMQDVGFVNFAGGDYHLSSSSFYIGKGTGGTNPGVNMDTLDAALNQQPLPPPPPPPVPAPVTASQLAIAGLPTSIAAGTAATFTVTATDANGKTATGYTGTVHFSSSDGQAILPSDYTFTTADNGVHRFSVTFETAGSASLSAADTASSSIAGSRSGITVTPVLIPASKLVVAGIPSTVAAGRATPFTVTAVDASGKTMTGYRGTIHFSSSDGQAILPGDYTFTAADNGVHTFSITFRSAGNESLTAVDKASNSIGGSESGITVTPVPVATSRLVLAGLPSSVTAGTPLTFTLTATDGSGNPITGYRGTVHFSSSDGQAILPANYTFTAADNGVHTFRITFETAGMESLTANDMASSINASNGNIKVNAASSPGVTGNPPDVTYHGGPLLQQVQIESVYYGQAWGTSAYLGQGITQVDGFLEYFTSSPYMDVLKQYNVSSGTFQGHDIISQVPAASTIDDSQIRTILNSEITSQRLHTPTPNQLYVFMVAPGMVVTANGQNSVMDFGGYHSVFTDTAGDPVYYVVVPYPAGNVAPVPLSAFQQDTYILSHEVSEAITNPDLRTGWFSPQQGEIGDIAEGTIGILNRYVVQGVWSQANGRVVIPSDTSSKTLQVAARMVDAIAGLPITGVVATFTSADPKATAAASFKAAINWGDGTTSTGTVSAAPQGGFEVAGTHSYAKAGTFAISVTVSDQAANVTAVGVGTGNVAPSPFAARPAGSNTSASTSPQLSVGNTSPGNTGGRPAAIAVTRTPTFSLAGLGSAFAEIGLSSELGGFSFTTAPAAAMPTSPPAQRVLSPLSPDNSEPSRTKAGPTPSSATRSSPLSGKQPNESISFWLDERADGNSAAGKALTNS